jgi:small subunit ribosomal protein S1
MTEDLEPQSPDPTPEAEAPIGSEPETGEAEASSEAEAPPRDTNGRSAAVAVAEKAPGGISPELLSDSYGEEVLDISAADFEALLSDHADVMGEFREGEIVHAKVLRVTESMVILEFGFKSEGAVPLDEFKDRDSIEPGQEVEVLLESLEDDDGIVVLSKKKADFLRVWEKIREAHEADEPVEGMLARKIKGGVTVDIMGVDAFLPGSQIALRRVPNIDDLLGQTFEFKIIKLNKRRRNIVVSRRVILEGEREKKRETLVMELLVGQVREGIVKNITDFGAFIDLGGLDGLLHITDMSWGRVGHPSEVVDIGAKLDVKVLDIDWDRERISLGLKQLLPYPWTDIDKKYPVGSRVRGKVVSITNYGAFIELEKGVEGLVHISEMSWTRNIRHPSKLVNIGDEIEAVVLKVDMQDEKISLGMKQIEEDPWLALPAKYPTGTQLEGVVRNLTSFGAFVEIESGIDGLVHVSDLSWTRRVEHPSEIIQKGDEVQVLVLDVDAEAKRISLGIKQLTDDPWPEISERFSAGVEPAGSVARVQEKGVVVDLGDDIEGFVPTSHSGVEEEEKLPEYFRAGEPLELKVIESDAANRRIVLEVGTLPERMDVPEPPPEEEPGEESGEYRAGAEAEASGEASGEASADVAADEPEAEAEADTGDVEAKAEADTGDVEAEAADEEAEAAEAEVVAVVDEAEVAESGADAGEPEAEAEEEADAGEDDADTEEGDADADEDEAKEEA